MCIAKPKLKDLIRLQVAPNWYSLGLQLELDQHALDTMEKDDGRDANTCTRKMFSKWICSNKDASYTSLVDALVAIEMKDVAEKVSQQFCKFCSLLNVHNYTMRTGNNSSHASKICQAYQFVNVYMNCIHFEKCNKEHDLPHFTYVCM